MTLQKKRWCQIICLVSSLLCITAAIIAVFKFNEYSLKLNVSEQTITLEYGVDEMPDIVAICKGTLINTNGTPVKTTTKGTVNLKKLGTYHITYTASYKDITLSKTLTFVVADTLPPVINLVSDSTHFTSPVAAYEEEGFTATDNYDGDLTSQVFREEKDGVVTYTATDTSGNTATVKRTIVYKDVIAPIITLTDGIDTTSDIGNDYVDPGFTAIDDCDGDLTQSVTVEGTVNGHAYGTYTVTYRVSDSSGNICEVKRNVKVGDYASPVITLNGEKRTFLKIGTAYSDPGFSASDNVDGNLTTKVQVSGSVDTSKMGINTLTYTVTDNAGNKATVTRSVYVYEKQAVSSPVNPGNKVVYLTFDDGPGKYTSQLLDILDKYGVKATFFVTNQFPRYQNMIGETYRRGHTIALHTYSHQYDIYKSEEAYYHDLSLINDICVQQTGVTPKIVRFPGGTSNTISRNYSTGIMTSISQSLAYHGYLYCDWNVSSGDAGASSSYEAVVNNVISGIQKHSVSIVLQHDIKKYSVEAVDEIIFWGLQNGYTFLPMDETTPMVQHSARN